MTTNERIAAIMRHEAAAHAELDEVHRLLEEMAEEAVAEESSDTGIPHSKARGQVFIDTAREIIRIGGCVGICGDCPFSYEWDRHGVGCVANGYATTSSPDPIAVASARQYLRDCGEEE